MAPYSQTPLNKLERKTNEFNWIFFTEYQVVKVDTQSKPALPPCSQNICPSIGGFHRNQYTTPKRNCDENNLYNPNGDRSKREKSKYDIPFAFRPEGFLLAYVPLPSFLPMHSARVHRGIPARTTFQLEF